MYIIVAYLIPAAALPPCTHMLLCSCAKRSCDQCTKCIFYSSSTLSVIYIRYLVIQLVKHLTKDIDQHAFGRTFAILQLSNYRDMLNSDIQIIRILLV